MEGWPHQRIDGQEVKIDHLINEWTKERQDIRSSQTRRQTDGQTGRQTDKQTDTMDSRCQEMTKRRSKWSPWAHVLPKWTEDALTDAPWGKFRSFWDTKNSLSQEWGSERSKRAIERVSAAQGASKGRSPDQANEWAVWANERTDERVAQFLCPNSWLFCPNVWRTNKGTDALRDNRVED